MFQQILKFMFNGYAVGCFQASAFPQDRGSYSVMLYPGLGYYKMQNQLKASGNARCYYDDCDNRTFFTVRQDSNERKLKLSDFSTVRQMSIEQSNRLSSEDLAELIIDSLFDAKILCKEDWQKAIAIATQEIDARKNVGDY